MGSYTLHVEQLSLLTKIFVYLPYFVALVFSYGRETYEKIFKTGQHKVNNKDVEEKYAPLVKSNKNNYMNIL